MRAGSLLGSLALAVLLQNGAASAEDCGPLKQINAVDLVAGPNRALVPVSLNGIPKLFLLDTGGDVTQISGEVAEELKLTKQDSNLKLLDMYGHASNKMVRIDKFALGRLHGENVYMAIQPNPNFGKGTRYVGLFGPDMMGRYDVDIDFGSYKMNYFSPEHCPGHVVYWPHAALAITPMTFHNRHIRLPVRVDGKELRAEIDTGATNTTMMATAAKRLFDIVPETSGNVPLNTQGMAAAFGRVFSTLDFEGVAVNNPHIVIVPDLLGSKDPNNGFQTGSRAKMVDDDVDRADMLIGMDILKKLHLYIAFDENRIYISEASTPPKLPDGAAAAASAAAATTPAQ
jgi:predicted aspartyl protease